ncbi:MAG: ATP-dependent zinc metalloprotease FtsH [Candidatus Saganbacteria bacterium]|nr:ATP-dependent zinc metalloprotease FtsH [Candidatus Saganbacteria bacterium]
MKNINWKNVLLYIAAILLVGSLLAPLVSPPVKIPELSFSEFLNQLDTNNIKEVAIQGENISGKLKTGKEFKTRASDYPNLVPTLRDKKVNFKIEAPSESGWFWNLIIQVVAPLAFFALLWWLLMRQAQSSNAQAMSFGRSRAKPVITKQKITFKDVAGVDEAKEELKEIVEFLKTPEKFQALGARIPKGLLLVGAPGTGKTLLARAIAGEAAVPFFSISGSDFVEMFVGVGAGRVRSLFQEAKKQTPCIIFMDEIDAVGRHRGAGLGGGHDEREQTLNQLLVEMDGFDPKTNIIIIAATNRPDILDPALLRPGRFDRQVFLDKPDLKGREEILIIHSAGKPLGSDADIKILARRTPGFTGADLENLMNEAAILAARADKKEINMIELEEAVDRVLAGPEKKSRVISDNEKEIVAFHEVGHALLSKLLPKADPVHKISILPRGLALGYTLQLPLEDKHLISKEEALQDICVLMGGRVAEEMIFNEATSGAQNDLERATALAKKMVCEYGMSTLGPRTFGKKEHQIFLGRDIAEMKDYSDQTADAIDKEVQKIIEGCYNRAKTLLGQNRAKMEEIAKALREKETLVGEELEALLKDIHV